MQRVSSIDQRIFGVERSKCFQIQRNKRKPWSVLGKGKAFFLPIDSVIIVVF
jgi:hypothetical protein